MTIILFSFFFLSFFHQGTRDFYPEEFRLKSWLHGKWRETSNQFGFEEYDAPVVESEQLYIRKGGEEITQQLYNFVDKGGRRLSLRPEMTPSLARMVLAKGKAVHYPLKWFSIPQCWRYERMTRGRRRYSKEHVITGCLNIIMASLLLRTVGNTTSGTWTSGECKGLAQRRSSLPPWSRASSRSACRTNT